MSTSAIKAGKAFVELYSDDTKLVRGLKQAQAKMKKWASSLNNIGNSLALSGASIIAPMSAAVKMASDLNETMSKFGAVFGEQTADVTTWLNDFTAAVGRSKRDVADGLAAFQGFFSGMGLGKDVAAGMSKEMVSLAVDFGSFHNVQDPEAIQRFISALSGSGEVLSMYGVNLMSAALDQKLLAMGFPTVTQGATEMQKVMARMSIIKESMGSQGAVGDAVKTAGGFSNQLKAMTGEIADAAGNLGASLIPVFQEWLTSAREVLKTVTQFVQENPSLVQGTLKFAAGLIAVGLAFKGVGTVIGIVGGLAKTITTIGTSLGFAMSPLGAFIAASVGVIALASAFGLLGSSVDEVSHAMQELSEKNSRARADSQVLMTRLQQFAEKQSLSNDESKEAIALIDSLQGQYGNLGLSIDATTGKIVGMTEAQKKLSTAMKAQEIADTQKELNEAEKNAAALTKNWGQLTYGEIFFDEEGGRERMNQEMKDREIEFERIKALRAKLAALKNGENPVDVSAAETEKRRVADEKAKKDAAERTKKTSEVAEEATTDLEKIEEERRRAAMTETERQIDDAQKSALERQRLLVKTMQGEHAREGGARPEILDMGERLKAKYAADEEADIAAIKKKAADEEAKRADEEAKKIQDRKQSIQDEITKNDIEAKFAATPGMDEQEKKELELSKQIALLKLERDNALREAKTQGADGNELDLIQKRFESQRKLAIIGSKTSEQMEATKTSGTFSAAAAARMGGTSPIALMKQQLEEAKKANEFAADFKNWFAFR